MARQGVTRQELLVAGAGAQVISPSSLLLPPQPPKKSARYPHLTTVAVDGGARPYVGGEGLVEVCRAFAARYDRPLMITETSVDGPVQRRLDRLDESLDACTTLHAEGVPLIGYVWFPLFTLVDRDYREASGPPQDWFRHMGLADLDDALERHDTPVLHAFSGRSRRDP